MAFKREDYFCVLQNDFECDRCMMMTTTMMMTIFKGLTSKVETDRIDDDEVA